MFEAFSGMEYCFCYAANYLDIMMVVTLCVLLLMGFPASFTLAGVGFLFAMIGLMAGVFDVDGFLGPFPLRIFSAVTNQVLIAVPLFIFMGVMLEKSRIAEDLLDAMARLFGTMRGGLGVSVTIVGALLAASTGIVGATVVTMGLLSLPIMLKRGYDPSFASGSIAAAGTLGQIIPPSIVLILLGDVISNAYQRAQLSQGNFAPDTVSVGDLFAGALIPGLMLVGLYLVYQLFVAFTQPSKAPAIQDPDTPPGEAFRKALVTLPPPLILIVAVLGSILGGIATPTEAAAVGAVGATFIAGLRTASSGGLMGRGAMFAGAAATAFLIALAASVDLRLGRESVSFIEQIGIYTAFVLCGLIAWGFFACLRHLFKDALLQPVVDQTARVTTMVFTILIGAALFSLVFRGLGGEHTVAEALAAAPGGLTGAIIAVMVVMFILGFFLDFIEITLVVVPLVAPPLLAAGVDPVWLGVMMAVNLQTSFLTPPFGFALFYLRGVAPDRVKTMEIYKGALPYVGIQLAALALLALAPDLATWLPGVIYD